MNLHSTHGKLKLIVLNKQSLQNPSEPDLNVSVSAQAGAFAGEVASIWLEWTEVKRFVQELAVFCATLKGSASLLAMSPKQFELNFTMIDSLGHVGVSFTLGKRHDTGHTKYECLLSGGFEVEPSQLQAALDWWRQMSTQ